MKTTWRNFSFLLVILMAGHAYSAELPDCAKAIRGPFPDRCIHMTPVSRILTIDLRLKPEHAKEEEVFIDIPYDNLRHSGAIFQLYYSGAMGKAQWVTFPDNGDIYIQPNSLMLPVAKWMKQGLREGQFIRVVMIVGE